MKSANKQKPATHGGISTGTVVRFLIIGALWLGLCGWFIARLIASDTPVTFMTIFPLLASGIVVFVPLYKKYIRNDSKRNR